MLDEFSLKVTSKKSLTLVRLFSCLIDFHQFIMSIISIAWRDHCSIRQMKKRTAWIIGGILTLLLIRQGYLHIADRKEEKAWYVSELHYKCSAQIDSIIRPGRALLRVTGGDMNVDREWQLKPRLRIHRILHLALAKDSLYDMRIPREAMAGDSVYINSEDDRLSIYRGGQLLVSQPLSGSLRSSLF
jgi:hypothetical protein